MSALSSVIIPITEEDLQNDAAELASNPTLTEITRNPRTGYPAKFEKFGWGFGGIWRQDFPVCPKWVEETTNYCKPVKGTGTSRRCPNTNRACQMFFNYQKFLQCYNRFEHRGTEAAFDKCEFFLRGVHPRVMQWYEELRDDGDWLGIKSNYKPVNEDDDDDDDW